MRPSMNVVSRRNIADLLIMGVASLKLKGAAIFKIDIQLFLMMVKN